MPMLQGLLPYGLYGLAILYFLSLSPHAWFDFPLDDAWIHRIYAQSFAFGHGFQYNQPGPQEAGCTSPLWAILTAPAHWLEAFGPKAVVVAVKTMGVLLGGLVLRYASRIAHQLSGSRPIGILTALLFALEPRLLFSALSGMENVLLLALWLGATQAYMTGRFFRSACLFSLTPPSRPEAVLLLPLWLGSWLLLERKDRPHLLPFIGLWLLAWLPMGLWTLFCHHANGHWLPTTFYVKSRSFQLDVPALKLAWEILTQHGWGVLGPLFGLGTLAAGVAALSRFGSPARVALLLYLALAPLLYAVGVVGSRQMAVHGYYWTRWMEPPALVWALLACLGYGAMLFHGYQFVVSRIRPRPSSSSTPFPVFPVVLAALAILVLVLTARPFVDSFRERRDRLTSDSRAIYLMNVRPAQWIQGHTPEGARIGANDAGAIRYFGRRWTLDLLGLNNARVAFDRRSHVNEVDWLAIFPAWFKPSIHRDFQPRQTFRIPLREYTVCRCPPQTEVTIFERIPSAAPAPYQDGVQIKMTRDRPDVEQAVRQAKLRDFDEALSHFIKDLRKNPTDTMTNLALRAFLEQSGKPDTEIARVLHRVATVIDSQGNLPFAIGYYREAVRLDPGFARAQNDLGSALASYGELGTAIVHLSEALQLRPNSREPRDNLALALSKYAEEGSARSPYPPDLRQSPDLVVAHIRLGDALRRAGQFAEARAHYDQALQIAPGNPDAARGLADLLRSGAAVSPVAPPQPPEGRSSWR